MKDTHQKHRSSVSILLAVWLAYVAAIIQFASSEYLYDKHDKIYTNKLKERSHQWTPSTLKWLIISKELVGL